MSSIEQVYCTHCTYGTSALEQREGELADRVLGYSTRAGSQERNELRNHYRSIERFLYYYLPSDTPPEEKQRLDAAAAPRRLFFCPSMGKLQMVGQVAYRQYDTAERLGSYFAHVLFSEVAGEPWSALDCLRLWNAPWVQEDSPDHPYTLPSLARLDDLWAGAAPAVGDDALLRFLQSPSGEAEADDAVIPSRWRAAPAETRIDLLVNALQGLLALGLPRRESVLLVVEPAIAALAFYGVARLLPKSLAEGLSFSTYEPNADRLPVTLAATTFFDPLNAEVRPDLYRRRGLVVNTYQGRLSDSGAPAGNYARFIVERLLEEGWPTVERLLENLESSGAKRPEDLEALVPTHRLASRVLSAVPPDDDSWRKSEVAVRYLSREVRHQLAAAEAGWPQLRQVIGTPNQLTVLELVASDGVPVELQRPAQFLLKNFPPERIADLVASPFLGRPAKIKALVSYVTSLGQLPEGCHLLSASGVRAATTDPLLPELLSKLPEPVLRRLYETTADAKKMELFAALVGACRSSLPTPGELKRLMLDILTSLGAGQFLEALVRHREELRACCPPPEPALGRRLGQALYELPMHPKSFEKWLSALDTWKGYFPFPNLAERRLAEWAKVRACLLALRDRGAEAEVGRVERLKNRLRPPAKTNFQPLAEALAHAMPRRTSELDELFEVVERCALTVPQFKERLELVAKKAGFTMRFGQEPAGDAPTNDDLFGGPGGEVEQLRRHRAQQARLHQLFREMEERLLVYADDSMGNRKLDAVQQIGQVLIGRPDFLADGKQKMEYYFLNGIWPTASAIGKPKHGFKRKKPKSNWRFYVSVAVAAAAFLPLIGYVVVNRPSSPTVAGGAVPGGNRPQQPVAIAKKTDTPTIKATGQTHANRKDRDVSKPPMRKDPEDRTHATPTNSPGKEPIDDSSAVATADPSLKRADRTTPPRSVAEGGEMPMSEPPSSPGNARPSNDGASAAPAAGETKKGENATEIVAEESTEEPTDEGIQITKEACSLPIIGARFLERVQLKEWPAAPGPITLSLRGLANANQHLGDHSLIAVSTSVGLRIELAAKGDDEKGADEKGDDETGDDEKGENTPNMLAMLTSNDSGVSFQWAEHGKELAGATQARNWLRRCVLLISNGSQRSYLSLASPAKRREEMAFEYGTKPIDLRGIVSAELHVEVDDEFVLGYGTIEIERGGRIRFGNSETAAPRSALVELPSQYSQSEAALELSRRRGDRETLILSIVGPGDKPGTDSKLAAADRHSLQKRLSEKRVQLDKRMKTQDIPGIGQAVQTLAGILKLSDRPTFSGNPNDKPSVDAFKREVDLKVLARARAREAQLRQLELLVGHAGKFSAVIYRQVEPGLFARFLVFGDPDQPAAEPSRAKRNDPDDDE